MQQYRIAQYLSTFKILTSAKKETNQAYQEEFQCASIPCFNNREY